MSDLVNHPSHYNRPGIPECIDLIEALGYNFHLGNAFKYLYRAGLKTESPVQDLEKCIWYIKRELDRLSRVQTNPPSEF